MTDYLLAAILAVLVLRWCADARLVHRVRVWLAGVRRAAGGKGRRVRGWLKGAGR